MNTVKLIYAYGNESISLDYTLRTDYTVVEKWLKLWKFYKDAGHVDFKINSESPTTINSLDYYHNEVFVRCQSLVNQYGIDIVEGWDKPPYTQEMLNVIHDDFAENVNIVNSNDDPEFKNILVELNHQIHTLEAAMSSNGLHSYIRSVLKQPWHAEDDPQDLKYLTQDDQTSKHNDFTKRHCLFLSYASLGKDLEMILQDKHFHLLERHKMVPKETVSPWFAICVPHADNIITDTEQADKNRIEWMNKLAKEHNIAQYGVDVNHWIHRPGRHIMGINHNGSQKDRQWFLKYGQQCILDKIIFDTDIIKTSVTLSNNTYSFK